MVALFSEGAVTALIETQVEGVADSRGIRIERASGASLVEDLLAHPAVLGCDLALVLRTHQHGGIFAAGVHHSDPVRRDVLRARLAAELRSGDQTDHQIHLGTEFRSLPEPVRAVVVEEGGAHLVLAPLGGRHGVDGVLLALRRKPSLSDGERVLVLAAADQAGRRIRAVEADAALGRERALVGMVEDAVVTLDPAQVVTSWNDGADRLYGLGPGETVGRPLKDLVRSRFTSGDGLAVRAALENSGRWDGLLRQTTCHGRAVEVQVRISTLCDPDGALLGYVCVGRDRTAALAGQAAVEIQGRFAQETLDALGRRAAVIDHDGVVISANTRWRAATAERRRCECGPVQVGQNWLQALYEHGGPDAAAAAQQVTLVLAGRHGGAHLDCRCVAGGPLHVASIDLIRIEAGRGGTVVVQAESGEPGQQDQQELRFRATHDELTGLPNRAALMDGLAGSLDRLDGSRKLAVLFCDLDGFKDINDGLGHAVGDQVLVAVARRLRQRCRQADVVARFGGDEFVVVLSIPDAAQALAMADRIVEVLAEPIVVGDAEVAPGVSIGITVVDVAPDDEDPVGTLLRDADTAMYHAKGRGRGRYEVFDVSLRANIAQRLELTAALHRAVGDGDLEVVYQTRRRCGGREVVGVEALASWWHPTLGRIGPDVFIPIAERTGRITELGEWVLRTALQDFSRVADRSLTLAVNISGRQLVGHRLPSTVQQALTDSGVEPERLVLEITESAFVDDPDSARSVLADLQRLGVQIALDDFGTGWSSLQYLRRLPVDQLKIDRSFVADLPSDVDACAVVAAVLGLGHGMGLLVVAEGVEDEAQLDSLREMGCDEYQGFIDGRPGKLDDVLGAQIRTTRG